MKKRLAQVAGKHLTLEFSGLSEPAWQSLSDWVRQRYGFGRDGAEAEGLDERLYPSFVLPGLTLKAGWDVWFGHYLLADSGAGDDFLRKLLDEVEQEPG